MPVMGVLGGGGGRLQRSSSVGRGDEARALTPSQPPRRAHSFRFPFVKFRMWDGQVPIFIVFKFLTTLIFMG